MRSLWATDRTKRESLTLYALPAENGTTSFPPGQMGRGQREIENDTHWGKNAFLDVDDTRV